MKQSKLHYSDITREESTFEPNFFWLEETHQTHGRRWWRLTSSEYNKLLLDGSLQL